MSDDGSARRDGAHVTVGKTDPLAEDFKPSHRSSMTDQELAERMERIAAAKPGKIFVDSAQLHHLAVEPGWFADMQEVCDKAAARLLREQEREPDAKRADDLVQALKYVSKFYLTGSARGEVVALLMDGYGWEYDDAFFSLLPDVRHERATPPTEEREPDFPEEQPGARLCRGGCGRPAEPSLCESCREEEQDLVAMLDQERHGTSGRRYYTIEEWKDMATLMLTDRPEPSYPSHRGQPGRQTERTTPVTVVDGHLGEEVAALRGLLERAPIAHSLRARILDLLDRL